jgi:hypothetical protein
MLRGPDGTLSEWPRSQCAVSERRERAAFHACCGRTTEVPLRPTRCIRCIGTTSAAHELPIGPRSTIVAIAMRHEEQCASSLADRSSQAKGEVRHTMAALISPSHVARKRAQRVAAACPRTRERRGRFAQPATSATHPTRAGTARFSVRLHPETQGRSCRSSLRHVAVSDAWDGRRGS